MENSYIYHCRAVAFLDVLGFISKLEEFEEEAMAFNLDHPNTESDESDLLDQVYYSAKANGFIKTFNDAVSKLDPQKFSWYLFSDNICITSKSSDFTDTESLTELLLIIAELYFEFMQKGYFLRGGIDYGCSLTKLWLRSGPCWRML